MTYESVPWSWDVNSYDAAPHDVTLPLDFTMSLSDTLQCMCCHCNARPLNPVKWRYVKWVDITDAMAEFREVKMPRDTKRCDAARNPMIGVRWRGFVVSATLLHQWRPLMWSCDWYHATTSFWWCHRTTATLTMTPDLRPQNLAVEDCFGNLASCATCAHILLGL